MYEHFSFTTRWQTGSDLSFPSLIGQMRRSSVCWKPESEFRRALALPKPFHHVEMPESNFVTETGITPNTS